MPLSWNEIRQKAITFSREWAGASRERSEAQTFWNEFFEVFGVRRRTVACFEDPVRNLEGNYNFIDLLWPGTMLAEHKSRGQSLSKAESQAMDYVRGLISEDRRSELPRYIVVSDFAKIALHDLETDETIEFPLDALHENLRAFGFIAGYRTQIVDPEDPANIEAATLLAGLYDTLKAGGYPDHDVERFMVRLLFCMFAEDTGLFGQPDSFRLYLMNNTQSDGSDLGVRLARYFDILNTPRDNRQANLDEQLDELPYVNGELFADRLPFADFNRDMRNQLLICCSFRWNTISPAVFGSLFQSIMEDAARRQIGAHYTSERDIMKLIKSLFLDELHEEFERAKKTSIPAIRRFHEKIGSLKFLDPACGCGNFLVIAYRELRELELSILKALHPQREVQSLLDFDLRASLTVSVDQMHGIEIEEWPVRIAEVAMWLMDHQMNLKVSDTFGQFVAKLPLEESAHITCANALRIDWNDVLPSEECDFVLGNPPFVGKKEQNSEQKADLKFVWHQTQGSGILDYVTCWYLKANEYTEERPQTRMAFVSTNSICQGEQVSVLWDALFSRGVKIQFAHRTFPWESEARGKAHVHVVIIGFGHGDVKKKTIFEYGNVDDELVLTDIVNISPYLVSGSDVVVTKRRTPLSNVPAMVFGTKLVDNGHFVLDADERAEVIKECPAAVRWIRPFTGSREFINGEQRWVLWLGEAQPEEIRKCAPIMERVECVRVFRAASKKASTVDLAATPSVVGENRQPNRDYLLVPKVSSKRRPYVPLGFLSASVVANGSALVVPGANHYHFGVLSSSMHMAWMRHVCGRMKSDYQYSATIIYNNYPWPESSTNAQCEAIETAAQGVLDARLQFPDATLADLYDPLTMPPPLRQAHNTLDRAVDRAYRRQPFPDERRRFEYLFEMYERLTAPLTATTVSTRKKGKTRRKKT